jgi:hypothetical protein
VILKEVWPLTGATDVVPPNAMHVKAAANACRV